jgi:hypothetical protein
LQAEGLEFPDRVMSSTPVPEVAQQGPSRVVIMICIRLFHRLRLIAHYSFLLGVQIIVALAGNARSGKASTQ